MITSGASGASGRDGDLSLYRCRGVHSASARVGIGWICGCPRGPSSDCSGGMRSSRGGRGRPVVWSRTARVGLHAGTPLRSEEGYVGVDVHRAARIAAAGHGGQVLVSRSTASLVDGNLRDLGEHRFKDMVAAERVFQLGSEDHPPIRSLARTNLPIAAWPLVGRGREVAGAPKTDLERPTARHAHRAGWLGKDAARVASGGRGLRRVRGLAASRVLRAWRVLDAGERPVRIEPVTYGAPKWCVQVRAARSHPRERAGVAIAVR
jgi:hypothetical protein